MVNPTYIATQQEVLMEKHRETYQKKTKELEQRMKRCAQERERYANTFSEKKKARIKQITVNHDLKCITPCKESVAMVNLTYIATEQEVDTSTLNVRQRKPIQVRETQTMLHRQNEEFLAKQRKNVSKMLVFDVNWKI
jgi:hypothetical protein